MTAPSKGGRIQSVAVDGAPKAAPVAERGAAPPVATAAPGSRDQGGRLLVLVVERDPHIRELESHFLEQAGYAIEFASDGKAALELARSIRPDVVITEILVPRLDGLALCRALKADPATSGISVLIFSILAASARAKEAGADAFLSKPLADRRLVGTVQSLLEKRQRRQPKEPT